MRLVNQEVVVDLSSLHQFLTGISLLSLSVCGAEGRRVQKVRQEQSVPGVVR